MLRLMLADDEQYEREYLERVIQTNYHHCLEIVYKASDGVELIEKIEECRPDIVLLDIKMPRMDGMKAAEEIRKKFPDIQMVIISAYSDFSYAKQALKLGITDYLLKPYLDSELRESLDKVLIRAREREDALAILSHSNHILDTEEFDFYRDMEKDLLWNLFFRRKNAEESVKELALWGVGQGVVKVVLISSPALISMGDFSQEVLKNYFYMEGVKVLNSIWTNQMVVCLYAEKEDAFTELNGCIRRARNYLSEENKIAVGCGVSGIYGSEQLADAYDEAAAFICRYSGLDIQSNFVDMTNGMKRICELEDQIIEDLFLQKKSQGSEKMMELIEELETKLMYQDLAVKLNFGRSLMTIIRGINRIPGVRIKTSEAIAQFEKLRQLNFDGDNLKYHVDFFADMKIQMEQEE